MRRRCHAASSRPSPRPVSAAAVTDAATTAAIATAAAAVTATAAAIAATATAVAATGRDRAFPATAVGPALLVATSTLPLATGRGERRWPGLIASITAATRPLAAPPVAGVGSRSS